ncbi:MAG: CPBP family intramembrane metalloprotease [Verrucomicrobiae bacterium]|nr:CPBP family intramembrane metalloprotease [Verrucomicrobiae bacterium]
MDHRKSTFWQAPWDTIQGMGEHSVVVWFTVALFMAGLVCEIILVSSLFRSGASSVSSRFSHVVTKPWGLGEAGLIAGTLFALLLIGSLVLSGIEHYGHLEGDDFKRAQMLASILVIDGLGLFAILLLLRVERIGLGEAFGMRARTFLGAIGRGVFCLLAVIPPVWVLAGMSQQLCEWFHISNEPQEMAQLFLDCDSIGFRAAIALLAVVAAPLFEEMFFRGLAYPALKQKIGQWPALVVTSLVFAAIHIHAPSFLPLCALAVGLTLAYEATGTLTVPIVMHCLFNLMSILVMAMVPS